jgi:hypothetical protein
MFGLMKSCGCQQTKEQRYHRRLHYCGTCKTLGRLHGQTARLVLNHDAVFLGELLSAISSADDKLDQWHRAFQSYNCLSLPKNLEDMPLPLQFAATAALIVAQVKFADRVMDSSRVYWKVPQWLFAKRFRAAATRLERWGFPVEELWQCSHSQSEREAELSSPGASRSAAEALTYLTGPTAAATALFFVHGARVVGNRSAQPTMHALGQAFGTLVYLLDALEDYTQDFRQQNFNALRAAYQLSGERLPNEHRQRVGERLWEVAAEIEGLLHELPMAASRAKHFVERLKTALSRRLSGERPAWERTCRVRANPSMTFRARSQAAAQVGKCMLERHLAEQPSLFGRLQAPLVFASALLVAFAFPHQAQSAASYRECMDLPFNLMFLGSLFSSTAATPFPLSDNGGLEGLARVGRDKLPKAVPGEEGGSSSFWSGCCDCGDCCECGGCCEGCSGCDC